MKKKKRNEIPAPEPTPETGAAEKAENKRGTKQALIAVLIIIAVVLGVGGIVAGIVIPAALNDEFIEDAGVNPIAEIKLSNGMDLRFEIHESECENASTNFIYLAGLGYFDGTIIFDGTDGWVRFGGWMANGKHRGDSDQSFLSRIPDNDRIYVDTSSNNKKTDRTKNKFGYRLKNDTALSNLRSQRGVLTFCYERSATEFQILADANAPGDTFPADDGGVWNSAPFGFAADSETLDNLDRIYALTRDDGTKFNHAYYRAPLDNNGLITIKSVKVTKKLASKWRDFDFMDFMYGTDGSKHLSSWFASQKLTGAK